MVDDMLLVAVEIRLQLKLILGPSHSVKCSQCVKATIRISGFSF